MQCFINHHFIHKDEIDDLGVEEMFQDLIIEWRVAQIIPKNSKLFPWEDKSFLNSMKRIV